MRSYFVVIVAWLVVSTAASTVFKGKDQRPSVTLHTPDRTFPKYALEELQLASHTYKRALHMLNTPGENSMRIDKFVERLKSFVNDTDFDVQGFDSEVQDLKVELRAITRSARTHIPSTGLAEQISFARHMFHVMEDSRRILRHYDDFSVPAHRLVYKITELGVRALALNNSQGELDLSIGSYLSKIVRLYHNLEFGVEKFKELQYVPYGTRQLFRVSVLQLRSTLEDLRSYLPIGIP